jgi:hypothetical protein
MHDRELCLEVLRQIEEAAIKIGSRFLETVRKITQDLQ